MYVCILKNNAEADRSEKLIVKMPPVINKLLLPD